ncbi:MAG: hypothetical protein ICV78_01335 [Tolypothrix sp. Co-bin9]|nr:hypothetical protein [Tolypothrix sp. Co-bin9]
MPVVSDFITILADNQQRTVTAPDGLTITNGFNTGGRHAPGTAYISFMVRGLTAGSPNVFVNNTDVGNLLSNDGNWQTQTVTLAGNVLNNGNNVLRISGVPGDPFDVRSVICHFHQDV